MCINDRFAHIEVGVISVQNALNFPRKRPQTPVRAWVLLPQKSTTTWPELKIGLAFLCCAFAFRPQSRTAMRSLLGTLRLLVRVDDQLPAMHQAGLLLARAEVPVHRGDGEIHLEPDFRRIAPGLQSAENAALAIGEPEQFGKPWAR